MQNTEVFQQAAKSSGKLFIIGILIAIVGLLKIGIFAYHFGAGREMDAFFAAMALHNVSVKFLQSGAFSAVFVPIFLENKMRDGDRGPWELIANLFNIVTVTSVGLCVILLFLAPWIARILVPGFGQASRDMVVNLFRLMLPAVTFSIVSSLCIGIINANKRFSLPELFTLLGSVANIIVVVLAVSFINIYAAAVAALIGNVVLFMSLIVVLHGMGYRHRWSFNLKDPVLRDTIKMVRPYFLYMGAMQARAFFTVSAISFLAPGSYAIYRYAADMVSRLSNLLNKPISTVAFTYLTEDTVRMRYVEAARKLSRALKMVVLVTLATILIILLTRAQITEIVFGRGAFDETALHPLALALSIFALGLLLNGVYDLFSKTLVSLKRTLSANVAAIIFQATGLVLLVIFSRQWGLLGAVWASPTNTLVAIFLLGGVLIWAKFPFLKGMKDIGFLRIVVSAAIAYSISWSLSVFFLPQAVPIVKIVVICSSFAAAYFVSCWVAGVKELELLMQIVVPRAWLKRSVAKG